MGQVRDFLRHESADAVGDKGHHIIGAERTFHRQREIVGRAFGLEIKQDRKFKLVVGQIDATPQRFTARCNPPHRVGFVCEHFLHFMGHERHGGLAGGTPPDKACAEILRMQRSHMEGRPQQRKAGRQQAPREFIEAVDQQRHVAHGVREPGEDRIDGFVCRTLGGRALHDLRRYQVLRIEGCHGLPVRHGHDQSPSNARELNYPII